MSHPASSLQPPPSSIHPARALPSAFDADCYHRGSLLHRPRLPRAPPGAARCNFFRWPASLSAGGGSLCTTSSGGAPFQTSLPRATAVVHASWSTLRPPPFLAWSRSGSSTRSAAPAPPSQTTRSSCRLVAVSRSGFVLRCRTLKPVGKLPPRPAMVVAMVTTALLLLLPGGLAPPRTLGIMASFRVQGKHSTRSLKAL